MVRTLFFVAMAIVMGLFALTAFWEALTVPGISVFGCMSILGCAVGMTYGTRVLIKFIMMKGEVKHAVDAADDYRHKTAGEVMAWLDEFEKNNGRMATQDEVDRVFGKTANGRSKVVVMKNPKKDGGGSHG